MPQKNKFYNIVNEGEKAHVYLFGAIGARWYDPESVSAADFVRDLKALEPKSIDLHISSGGGDVIDGIVIHNAIRSYAGTIDAYIEGMAASAASYIAIACSTVTIADNAFFMIHKAISWFDGNADGAREFAQLLDMHDSNIADMYVKKAGGTRQEWLDLMSETKWYRGVEAVDAGLCDDVLEGLEVAACIDAHLAKVMALENIPDGIQIVDCYTPDIVPNEAELDADDELDSSEAEPVAGNASAKLIAFSAGIYESIEGNQDV